MIRIEMKFASYPSYCDITPPNRSAGEGACQASRLDHRAIFCTARTFLRAIGRLCRTVLWSVNMYVATVYGDTARRVPTLPVAGVRDLDRPGRTTNMEG